MGGFFETDSITQEEPEDRIFTKRNLLQRICSLFICVPVRHAWNYVSTYMYYKAYFIYNISLYQENKNESEITTKKSESWKLFSKVRLKISDNLWGSERI